MGFQHKMSGTQKSRKRSRTEKKGKPTRSGLDEVVEEESPDVILLSDGSGGRDLSIDKKVARNWDDIDDREEMYLANTREELYELIMKKTTFKNKVGEKDIEKLKELFESFLVYSRQNIEELQLLEQVQPEDEDDEDDKLIREDYRRFISLVSFQHRRIGWMVGELFSRCREAKGELESSVSRVYHLTEENGQLRERIEALTKERDELLGKLDSRRADEKDASVHTGAEVSDVEMAEYHVPSARRGIPQNLVEILEATIERKVGELLSRVGLSVEREREELVRPSNTGKTLGPNGS